MVGDDLVRTDDGMKLFMELRAKALGLLGTSGSFTGRKLIEGVPGDNGQMFQCVDRMAAMGTIRYVGSSTDDFPGDRIYIKGR